MKKQLVLLVELTLLWNSLSMTCMLQSVKLSQAGVERKERRKRREKWIWCPLMREEQAKVQELIGKCEEALRHV